jgi:hypothetical protein
MDDDATTRNQMKPYRSWTNSRNRLIKEGKLPPEHPGVKCLCDMNHRVRCLSRKEYALAYAALKVSTLNYVDAIRLKKYKVCNNKEHQWVSARASDSSLKCTGTPLWGTLWLRGLVSSRPMERRPRKRKNLVYRDKAKDRILYNQLEATRTPFLTLDRLQEMMSKFDTQKNENTMMVITGTIPKTMFFAATIYGKGRTYLEVGHDSAGTINHFSRLYLMLGIEMTATSRDHFVTAGEEARRNDKEYKKNMDVTKKRAIKKSEAS